MASSSTSTSTSHNFNNNDHVFDVFINHRGPDVKKTLATDLYHRLCKHDLRVFLDEQELLVGENLTPQIESAIRTSYVNIAIFSLNYAYSKWCLDELVLMVECMSKYKSTIIPVFYRVKPTELRWVEGGKGVYAEALHTLQEKKDGGRPRYDSNTLEKWRKALSSVAEIIGFDGAKYNSMEQLLEDVVEGVLKNVKRRLYVSEYPTGLQEKLNDFEITMSLQQEDGKVRVIGIVGHAGVGKTTLAKEFFNIQRSKYKRLCILEDIRDNPLTTLQKYLLKVLTQKDEEIRSINEGKGKLGRFLPSSDCLIILDDVDNIEQLEALLYPAKDALKSSSLILVTSGNKDVLIRSQIPETSIYRLQGLQPEHSRELFCWHAFGEPHPAVGFEEVVEKFLGACRGLPLSIKLFGSHLCGINDLNYWEAQFLKISNRLPHDIQGRLRDSYDGLDEEEKKIFLDITCFFRGEKRDRVIRTLSHLSECSALQRLPDSVGNLAGLQHLNLSHCSTLQTLSDSVGHLTGLQHLDLFHCSALQTLPDSVGSLAGLQHLNLGWCSALQTLPDSVGNLAGLQHLDLVHCHALQRLPDSFGNLAGLQHLNLVHCLALQRLPDSFGKLAGLQHLNLSYCSTLRRLPDSVGNLAGLQHLNLSYCSALQTLPDSVGNLAGLQRLNLSECSALQWDAGVVEQLRQRLEEGFIEESSLEVSCDGEGFNEESSNVGEGFNEESNDESREIGFSEESGYIGDESSSSGEGSDKESGYIGDESSADGSSEESGYIGDESSADGSSEESGYPRDESWGTDSSEESEW